MTRPPRSLLLACLVAAVGVAAIAPAPALAGAAQESMFQEDRLLLTEDDEGRRRTLDELRALGVDTLRVTMIWARVAPARGATKRPRGFDPADPNAYSDAAWDRHDDLIRDAQERGLRVMLTLTGPIPGWASRCRGSLRRRNVCRPNPREFHSFVRAVGKRYGGKFYDENQGGELLPRVDAWSIWNEPNQGAWLVPQLDKRGGQLVPESAVIYRDLVRAAVEALERTRHGDDRILIGETAPLGSKSARPATITMAPVPFYRALFCLDDRGNRLRGRAARRLRCSRYEPLRVTGVAHHPYTRGAATDPRAPIAPDAITITTLDRLVLELDRAGTRGRIRDLVPIFLTEFGFSTNPPDTRFGVPLDDQAAFLNYSDWLAYQEPRVESVGHFQLEDAQSEGVFQTGLRLADGDAKPAYAAYRLPIWVREGPRGTTVWGQVRPAPPLSRELVKIQYRTTPGGRWSTLKTIAVSSAAGYFTTKTSKKAVQWRLRWRPSPPSSSAATPPPEALADRRIYTSRTAAPERTRR